MRREDRSSSPWKPMDLAKRRELATSVAAAVGKLSCASLPLAAFCATSTHNLSSGRDSGARAEMIMAMSLTRSSMMRGRCSCRRPRSRNDAAPCSTRARCCLRRLGGSECIARCAGPGWRTASRSLNASEGLASNTICRCICNGIHRFGLNAESTHSSFPKMEPSLWARSIASTFEVTSVDHTFGSKQSVISFASSRRNVKGASSMSPVFVTPSAPCSSKYLRT
mmetsp:Transcript_18433/g.63974  ORF Transcript_18433/g.63974 Transcript_18433/m.63974 type:complete len:224 (-) Transcript_18433:2699-3370(-)